MNPKQNRLMILALKRAIVATFNHDKWIELGYITGLEEKICSHPRLLKSLAWGNSDYSECIVNLLEEVKVSSEETFNKIINFVNPKRWLEKHDKKLFDQIYGSGIISVENIEESADILDVSELNRHSERIQKSLNDDPEQAIGSTKELLESVFKAILGKHGYDSGNDDLPKLWAQVRKKLNLNPSDNKMPGYEAYKKMLGSLNQIVDSICEIRGIHGTGHGRAKTKEPDKVEAKLVVNSGITLATYVLEKYLNVDVLF